MKITVIFLSAVLFLSCASDRENPSDFVNIFIGTGKMGNTHPSAAAPFGMISCGPDNVFDEKKDEYISRSGYRFEKDSIRQFSMTHVSGWGCHGALDIPFMPVTKTPRRSPVNDHRAYASAFSHQNEKASPGYYRVYLDDYQTEVQITAAERSAILEIQYPADKETHIVFAPTNCANGITAAELNIDAENNQIYGRAASGGFCWRDPSDYDYTVFFVAQFNKPVTGNGVWIGSEMLPGVSFAEGDDIAAYLTFENTNGTPLEMRTAISFVSIDNARENLLHELKGKSFSQVRKETAEKWNRLLSKVEFKTDDHDMKVQAYTALYRNFLHPNIFSDVNGQYRGFNDSVYVMPAGHHKYVNFSTWDTYRTTAQLQGLLVPDRAADMIKSLYLDAGQGSPSGLPIWGYFNNETWVMNGHSSIPLIANMYAFGARSIDLEKIKDIMIWTADNKYRRGEEYIKYGYVPDYPGPHNYSVSMTLEYSTGDYAIAQMCLAHGDSVNYKRFMERSQSVFNLFNDETGCLQRKDRDGNWVFPFERSSETGFNEGNSAQYTWNIPHDMAQLVKRLGGPEKAVERLDEFTSKILVEGWHVSNPYYWPGNEPGFIVPFVYTHAEAHEKTRYLVRKVSSELFGNSPDGMPGDDDLGATSAMNLFFMLGMYPVKPGIPEFCLTGSMFDRVKIKLNNGSIIDIISRGSPESETLQSIRVNRQDHDSFFFNIDELLRMPQTLHIEYIY